MEMRLSAAFQQSKPEGRTRLGRVLIAGAEEMLAQARAEIKLESSALPELIDVEAIRTLQEWEQSDSDAVRVHHDRGVPAAKMISENRTYDARRFFLHIYGSGV